MHNKVGSTSCSGIRVVIEIYSRGGHEPHLQLSPFLQQRRHHSPAQHYAWTRVCKQHVS